MAKINVIKVQTEIIKTLINNGRFAYCEYNDGMWVTTDGLCAYNIPKSQFLLTYQKSSRRKDFQKFVHSLKILMKQNQPEK